MSRLRRVRAALRAGRLIAVETHRDGPQLPARTLSNASAMLLAELGCELPARIRHQHGGIRRDMDALVCGYFASVAARAELTLVQERAGPARTVARRAPVPPWAGLLAAVFLTAAHLAGLLMLDAAVPLSRVAVVVAVVAAVVVPALIAGRIATVLGYRPGAPLPRAGHGPLAAAILLAGSCLASAGFGPFYAGPAAVPGALLLGVAPLAVALLEAVAAHPDDRADRRRHRAESRAARRGRRARRRYVRALDRWVRAHRRLRLRLGVLDAVADENALFAHSVLWRAAARFGLRVPGSEPGPVRWPDPPVRDRALDVPRRLLVDLAPDPDLADAFAARILAAGGTGGPQ